MRPVYLLLAFLTTGCATLGFHRPEDITLRPFAEWSERDCLTLLIAAIQHNYHGPQKPPIGVLAAPYTPTVVFALNRMSQDQHQWSDGAFRERTNVLLREMSGVYVDWEHGARLYNSELRALSDPAQMDSLTFMVILTNNTWPCATPRFVVGDLASVQLMNNVDWPCSTPDISDLDRRLWLVNDRGDTVKPVYVWGRRNDLLTTDETLFVKFPLNRGSLPFLHRGEKFSLVIYGLGETTRLPFNVASLR